MQAESRLVLDMYRLMAGLLESSASSFEITSITISK